MATLRRNPTRVRSQKGQQEARAAKAAKEAALKRQILTALSPIGGADERLKRKMRKETIAQAGGLTTLRAGPMGKNFLKRQPRENDTFQPLYPFAHWRGGRKRGDDGKLIPLEQVIPQRGALGRGLMAEALAVAGARNRAKALRQRRIARKHGGTSAQGFANTTYLFREPMTPREKFVKRLEKRIAQALANPNKPLKLRRKVPVQNEDSGYFVVSAPTYRTTLLDRYNRGKGAAQMQRKREKAYFKMIKNRYKTLKRTRQPIPPRLLLAYKSMLQMKRAKALAKKKAKVNGGSSPVARGTRAGAAAGMKRYEDLARRQKAAAAKRRRRRGVASAA